MKFLNEDIRLLFHSLPLEKQEEWIDVSEGYAAKGFQLTILFVDQDENGTLEVSIRVDKKLY